MPEKKKLSEAELAEKHKEDKKRKKQLKQLAEKLKKQKQQQAIADEKVKLIYESGLSEAYKCKYFFHLDFVTEAFKQDVKFNIFEYAAQKVLKFEKLRRDKNKKISEIQKDFEKKQLEKSLSQQKVVESSPQKKNNLDASKQKKKQLKN